jgi:CDP-paratose 2-epimerase
MTLPLRERFGICQWFHFQDLPAVKRCAALMRELGLRHLRTGISWADYYRPDGEDWYHAMLAELGEFDVLLSVWHTPPSIAEANTCCSPPRRLLDYADFIDGIITRHSAGFSHLELWNEPNNKYKWSFVEHDPEWRKFGEMVGCAAYWARQRNVRTVLGGMMPVDPHWLELMADYGALAHMDVVAIHGFPGMWWDDRPNWEWYRHWNGWGEKVGRLSASAGGRPVWITETGFATWRGFSDLPELLAEQEIRLGAAAMAQVPRVYWYSMMDLDPALPAIEGYHVDEHEYHLGLVRHDGRPKPAFERLRELLELL